MALVVEDGSGVTDANSYVSDDDFTAFAQARGITLPGTAEEREVLLIKAMDYLETLNSRFMGYRTSGISQALLWPRSYVYFDGVLYSNAAIPPELKKVQMVIAVAAKDIELFPNSSGVARLATRKTVGPITVEYSEQGAAESLRPIISQANALLEILFGKGTGQMPVSRA